MVCVGVGEGVPVRVHMFVCTCVCLCVIELTRLNARAQVRWPHDPRFVHPKPKLKAEKAQCGSASGSDEVPFTVTAKGERTCVWVRRESPMLKLINRRTGQYTVANTCRTASSTGSNGVHQNQTVQRSNHPKLNDGKFTRFLDCITQVVQHNQRGTDVPLLQCREYEERISLIEMKYYIEY